MLACTLKTVSLIENFFTWFVVPLGFPVTRTEMYAILSDCSCRSHNHGFLLSVISSGVSWRRLCVFSFMFSSSVF